MKRKTIQILLVAGAILFAASLVSGLYVRHLFLQPYKGYSASRIAVTIPRGASVHSISESLMEKGVLRYSWLLKTLFIVKKTQGQSKAGDYVFDRPFNPFELYDKLMKGETQYTLLRIVEGMNVFEIEKIFTEKQIGNPAEFRKALQSSRVRRALDSIESGIPSAEGFLFPETYFLSAREHDVENVVLLLIEQFKKEFGEKEKIRARELGMTVLQVATLASLIEKETGLPSERPLISGVFHNRLRKRMLIQCDPTVIYAMLLAGNYDGHISKKDLQIASPYNTYAVPGLPPGPICNPGRASLLAALHPEETGKLYFVSRNDGSHYFSSTLAEHNRAVQRYQRSRGQ